MKKDHYSVLGVQNDATLAEIKKAFHALAHKHHPDKNGGNGEKFKEINEAYQTLSDRRKRAEYDASIKKEQEERVRKEEQKQARPEPEKSADPVRPKAPPMATPPKNQTVSAIILIILIVTIVSAISVFSPSSSDTPVGGADSTQSTTNQNNQTIADQTTQVFVANLPTEVGQCTRTTVSSLGTRLTDNGQNVAGSESAINYSDGGYQVFYEDVQGIDDSLAGDEVNLCLVSVPTDCPVGDDRGKVYSATNLRTGESWEAQDSEHSCGGQ